VPSKDLREQKKKLKALMAVIIKRMIFMVLFVRFFLSQKLTNLVCYNETYQKPGNKFFP
jgi:hypothetical protein